MERLYVQISEGFEALHNKVEEYEKRQMIQGKDVDISYNDIHIIAAVGIGDPRNMSTIARMLSVTVGSLTTAMNALVRKGYVYRERCEADRRVVYIRLTAKGMEVYREHQGVMEDVTNRLCSYFPIEDVEHVLEMLDRCNEMLEEEL